MALWVVFRVEIGVHISRHLFQFGVIYLFPPIFCAMLAYWFLLWCRYLCRQCHGHWFLVKAQICWPVMVFWTSLTHYLLLVRKEAICSMLVSRMKSRNLLFTDVGKLWLSTICVVHWMPGRLMSPPLQNTAPLLFLFNLFSCCYRFVMHVR